MLVAATAAARMYKHTPLRMCAVSAVETVQAKTNENNLAEGS